MVRSTWACTKTGFVMAILEQCLSVLVARSFTPVASAKVYTTAKGNLSKGSWLIQQTWPQAVVNLRMRMAEARKTARWSSTKDRLLVVSSMVMASFARRQTALSTKAIGTRIAPVARSGASNTTTVQFILAPPSTLEASQVLPTSIPFPLAFHQTRMTKRIQ